MTIVSVSIDLAKNIFAAHGVNEAGRAELVRRAMPGDKLHALITALSCNPKSAIAGSTTGIDQCACFSRVLFDRELLVAEERCQARHRPGLREFRWLEKRFSSICELGGTKKRIARIKAEIGAK